MACANYRMDLYGRPSNSYGLYNPHPVPPVVSSRSLASRHRRMAFVMMHEKRGWQTLASKASSSNVPSREYLRLSSPNSSDVEVEKGTLVEIDPNSHFDPATNISVIVVSLDRPEVKISLLMKELLPIDEEAFNRLLPLKPAERYSILTEKSVFPILSAQVGDTVWCFNGTKKNIGMIQYIGPVEGLGNGHWIGVELLDSNAGTSDGMFGHRRYFSAPPCSSLFVSSSQLVPYGNRTLDKQIVNNSYPRTRTTPTVNNNNNYCSQDKRRNNGQREEGGRVLSPNFGKLTIVGGFDPDPIRTTPTIEREQKKEQKNNYIPTKYEDENLRVVKSRNVPKSILKIGERVVWISDQGPEMGTVRWIGNLSDNNIVELFAGVEFDHPVGHGDGTYMNRRLFRTQKNHASLVPLDGLIKENDFTNPTQNGISDYGDRPNSEGKRNLILSPAEENYLNELAGRSDLKSIPNISVHHHQGHLRDTSSPSPPPPPPPPRIKSNKNSKSLSFDDLSEEKNAITRDSQIDIGSLVELRHFGTPQYGVVRWIGWLLDQDKLGVGVELEEEVEGATNGWQFGSQLFACPEKKGVFVPLGFLKLDKRFDDEETNGEADDSQYQTFGNVECPVLPGYYAPIELTDVKMVCGRNKGVQGHKNSCYLDATLFAMFSFTSVFDSLLYRPPNKDDIPEYKVVQKVLREEIVNPLRKNIFVRADRVMKLRKFLDHLTSVRGLLSEEKDPEEFLNSLLTQTLKAAPFLELSSGQTSHLYQLFVERDESVTLPTVQELFEQSFLTSSIKLKRVPSVLILQMPRFGRQFKVYDRILPSQYLDVTDIIENSPRQCIICGKLATIECLDCFRDHGTGLDSTAFCDVCIAPVHNHQKRRHHKPTDLAVPSEFLENRTNGIAPRLYMELFAVVCIETSHYVSFVKCGTGPDAPWCFFDSMADRKGEINGYNIPEVSAAKDVPRWFQDEGIEYLNSLKDDKMLPLQAKRFICDSYMCFYQSPEVMMYE